MTFKKKQQQQQQQQNRELGEAAWLYRSNTVSGKPSIYIVASEVKNSKFPGANQLAICKCDCIRI